MITYNIELCIGGGIAEKKSVVKCHDTGVNFLASFVRLVEGKWGNTTIPYAIPEGSVAVLEITKPDNKYVVIDGEVGAGGVFFQPPTQAFTAAGMAKAEVHLFGTDGRRITTDTFFIDVTQEVAEGCAEDSENYVDVMAAEILKAVKAAEEAENSAEAAEEAKGEAAKSATNAKTSEDAAAKFAEAAKKSETALQNTVEAAAQSARNAATYEASAKQSRAGAAANSSAAQEAANASAKSALAAEESARAAARSAEEASVVVTVGRSADCDFVCDGTDDQDEINAAINSLPATGGVVLLKGNCYVSNEIIIQKANVTIRATVRGLRVERKGSWKKSLLTLLSGAENCSIEGVLFQEINTQFRDPNASLVTVSTNSASFYDCTFSNSGVAVSVGNVVSTKFDHCIFYANATGLTGQDGGETFHANNCIFDNNNVGVRTIAKNEIKNCLMRDNGVGIHIAASKYGRYEVYKVTGNVIYRGTGTEADYTADQHTIYLAPGVEGAVISGNVLLGKDVTDESGKDTNIISNGSGGESGGVTSWNDLLHRPFGDGETVTGEYTITPETGGSLEDAEKDSSGMFFKAADIMPTTAEMTAAVASLGGESITIGATGQTMELDGATLFADGGLFVVYKAGTSVELQGVSLTFPTTGVWANTQFYGVTLYFPSVTHTGYTKLDNKYLDLDWVPKRNYAEKITLLENETVSGNTTYTFDVTEEDLQEMDRVEVVFDGNVFTLTATRNDLIYGLNGTVLYGVGDPWLVFNNPQGAYPFYVAIAGGQLGIYTADTEPHIVSISISRKTIVPIPDDFIPDSAKVRTVNISGTFSKETGAKLVQQMMEALAKGHRVTFNDSYVVLQAKTDLEGWDKVLLAKYGLHLSTEEAGFYVVLGIYDYQMFPVTPTASTAKVGQVLKVKRTAGSIPTAWEYVDLPDSIPVPNTAAVGQTIAVKAVDANGKPTEWQAVDMASGGGGDCLTPIELLNVTLTEEANSVSVDTYNGKPFTARKILAFAKFPNGISTAANYITCWCNDVWTFNNYNMRSDMQHTWTVELVGDRWLTVAGGNCANDYSAVYATMLFTQLRGAKELIRKVSVHTVIATNTLPVGTQVRIFAWGVEQ